MESLQDKELVIGGDGRCDSMGHSAKFGSYVFMELDINKLLSIELVQSNEAPKQASTNMELVGIKRSAPFFKDYSIKAVITDRHRSLAKWIKESWKVTHYFDCWHVVKGLCKKMEKLAKKKGMESIRDWIKSIKYHLYWCVMSSPEGDREMIKKKWLACVDHIQNKHKNCVHGRLKGKRRKWLKKRTEVCDELVDLLTKKMLLNDISKMSALGQTSGVEAYHSVLNHFAPKMIKFSHSGMYSSVLLLSIIMRMLVDLRL
ncbi:uncharacterized protein LOC135497205 [Lineus longissimus]|uniref:uncharacterized protein LOC135497205 n=1 Tax=Lineus longissimus TaxID=88925 RepID=UPI00315D1324